MIVARARHGFLISDRRKKKPSRCFFCDGGDLTGHSLYDRPGLSGFQEIQRPPLADICLCCQTALGTLLPASVGHGGEESVVRLSPTRRCCERWPLVLPPGTRLPSTLLNTVRK